LEEGKKLSFYLLILFLEVKLEKLQKYINKILAKGFIRELSLLASTLIFFLPKPEDIKERLIIDYRKLNIITIKNRYSLLLVSKL
jgi:hypothetical protein